MRGGTAYKHNYSLDCLAAYICVQLSGIFRFTLESDDGRARLVVLGRWAVRSLVGDATGAQILHCAAGSTYGIRVYMNMSTWCLLSIRF